MNSPFQSDRAGSDEVEERPIGQLDRVIRPAEHADDGGRLQEERIEALA